MDSPALHFASRTEERRQTEAERHLRAKRASLLRQAARSGAPPRQSAPPRVPRPLVLRRGRAPAGCLAPQELPASRR